MINRTSRTTSNERGKVEILCGQTWVKWPTYDKSSFNSLKIGCNDIAKNQQLKASSRQQQDSINNFLKIVFPKMLAFPKP
jgi:hypothetical protein